MKKKKKRRRRKENQTAQTYPKDRCVSSQLFFHEKKILLFHFLLIFFSLFYFFFFFSIFTWIIRAAYFQCKINMKLLCTALSCELSPGPEAKILNKHVILFLFFPFFFLFLSSCLFLCALSHCI